VPAGWSGWLEIPLEELGTENRLRLLFPGGDSPFLLGGLTFGHDPLLWPWAQKAQMTLLPKAAPCRPITVSFDPADLLPAPLRQNNITILDDRGSSVLMEVHRH
jgi:hypothetical protein